MSEWQKPKINNVSITALAKQTKAKNNLNVCENNLEAIKLKAFQREHHIC